MPWKIMNELLVLDYDGGWEKLCMCKKTLNNLLKSALFVNCCCSKYSDLLVKFDCLIIKLS